MLKLEVPSYSSQVRLRFVSIVTLSWIDTEGQLPGLAEPIIESKCSLVNIEIW